jgi:2-polyprenyl-3-methyl-5-hydroxy-6-metoxy-1,4-benzoquinol methylase
MTADLLQSLPVQPVAHRTFRDPAGSVELRPDAVYRTVHPPHDTELLEFLESPLAAGLVAQGRLVASEVVSYHPLVLRHPRVAFPSYPWEWSPSQWLAAAELTLTLCLDVLEQGWLLKDATPLNVLFQGPEPIFVDVLSVARLDTTQPIWFAYGQFIRTFLLPMLAHSRLGWPLSATIARRDGYEPEDLYNVLPWTARLSQPALTAVTLPQLLASSKPKAGAAIKSHEPDIEYVQHILRKTFTGLLKQMRRATPAPHESTWTGYTNALTHYEQTDRDSKIAFVTEALAVTSPTRVLDVGCNSGVFSTLADNAGAEVVSIDTDQQTIDRFAASLRGSNKNILPLVVNLAHPTPAAGWRNMESASFLDRVEGTFDMVMMLAVIHHVLLREQVPLDRIAELCASITTRHLILEWVPPTDEKFLELVRGRESIFAPINEAAFRQFFGDYFTIVTETKLANGRILFLFRKKASFEKIEG